MSFEYNWQKNLVHQLATPLTNILFILENLENITKQNKNNYSEITKKLLDREILIAISETKRIFQLIKNRETEDLDKTKFVPDLIIEKILRSYQKPYLVNCFFRKSKRKLVIYGQQEVFIEIISHLLNNAAEAYQQNLTNREISVEVIKAMNGLNLIIGDNGKGFTWWQKILATHKNVSWKKIKSGLGLYRAKNLIKQKFGGQLKIFSIPNKGTIMIVYLPLA